MPSAKLCRFFSRSKPYPLSFLFLRYKSWRTLVFSIAFFYFFVIIVLLHSFIFNTFKLFFTCSIQVNLGVSPSPCLHGAHVIITSEEVSFSILLRLCLYHRLFALHRYPYYIFHLQNFHFNQRSMLMFLFLLSPEISFITPFSKKGFFRLHNSCFRFIL